MAESDNSNEGSQLNLKSCRFCLDGSDVNDLISPCACKGSNAWVHRKCLDTWILANHRPDAAIRCPTCKIDYTSTRILSPDNFVKSCTGFFSNPINIYLMPLYLLLLILFTLLIGGLIFVVLFVVFLIFIIFGAPLNLAILLTILVFIFAISIIFLSAFILNDIQRCAWWHAVTCIMPPISAAIILCWLCIRSCYINCCSKPIIKDHSKKSILPI